MTQTKAELLETKHQGDIRLGDANSSHYVGFKAPATVSSSLVWTLPAADGSANQFLKTNASGVLSWGTVDTSTLMPLGGGTFTGDVTFDGATAGRDIIFDRSEDRLQYNDNAKASFGTGNDFYIAHDGTNTDLATANAHNIWIRNVDGTNEAMAAFRANGACELYHNGTKKIETSAAGIAITGAATISTDLTVTGDLTVSGTTTTINTQTLDVEDKNVVIGKVSSPSDTTADGGGWTLKGASDKTFNWVNATDAWTSSEHIHLGDNKILKLGTDTDAQLTHTGGYGSLNVGTGYFVNDIAGDWYVRNSAGSEQRIIARNNGSVDLYHDNTKRLETTSGGINVTGAITVNGAALSSAPTITATASGSIAANTAVHLQSDGTVKTATVTAPSLGSLGAVASGDSYPIGGATVYNSTTKTIVQCYKNPSDGRPYAVAGTISGTTITWGAAAEVSGGNDYDVERLSLTMDTDGTYLLTWDQSNSPYHVRYSLFTVDGTTIGTETVGSAVHGNSEATQVFNTGINEFMVFYKFSSWTRRRKGTRSGTSITWSGDAQLYSEDYVRGCYLSGPGRIILPYSSSGLKYRTFNVGGMTLHGGGNIYVPSTSWTGNASYWDMAAVTANQFVLVWHQTYNNSGTTINQLSIKTGYMGDSDGTVTWGATLDAAVSGGITNSGLTVHYNSTTGKCQVSYCRQNRTGRYGKEITLSSNNSGATCTVGSEYELYYSSNSSTANTSYELGNTVAAGDDGQDAFIFYVGNSGLKYKMRTAEGSSMSDENFIGFSDGTSYTNGQTATINIVGNQTTQSSLTPAEKYYIQNDGSIGTTATSKNIYAGIALTSTKLAIKA